MVQFTIDDDIITLTDQLPMIEKNIEFPGGWTLGDLIEAIHRRVFFWRGPAEGLLKANQGYPEIYRKRGHDIVFLRIPFDATNRLNTRRGSELGKYNSGAARMNQGSRIPRRPSTFVRPVDADLMKGKVQEVVFRDFVVVPENAEVCRNSWEGPWQPLF